MRNQVRELSDPVWPTYATGVLGLLAIIVAQTFGTPSTTFYAGAIIFALSGGAISASWILYRNLKRRRQL